MERADFRIEIWIRTAAAIIELDDVGETLHAAIVHVGRGSSDLAHSEGVLNAPRSPFLPVTRTGLIQKAPLDPRDTGVVKRFIAQKRTRVASRAVCGSIEKIEAAALDCAQRRRVVGIRNSRASVNPVTRRQTR
jgi:hypothetical protein